MGFRVYFYMRCNMVDKDFDDGNVKKEKIKIKSKKTDKEKGKRTKQLNNTPKANKMNTVISIGTE